MTETKKTNQELLTTMRGCGRKVSLGYQMNEANCALDQCTFVTTYMHNMNSVSTAITCCNKTVVLVQQLMIKLSKESDIAACTIELFQIFPATSTDCALAFVVLSTPPQKMAKLAMSRIELCTQHT